jgi:hypothetical protein
VVKDKVAEEVHATLYGSGVAFLGQVVSVGPVDQSDLFGFEIE